MYHVNNKKGIKPALFPIFYLFYKLTKRKEKRLTRMKKENNKRGRPSKNTTIKGSLLWNCLKAKSQPKQLKKDLSALGFDYDNLRKYLKKKNIINYFPDDETKEKEDELKTLCKYLDIAPAFFLPAYSDNLLLYFSKNEEPPKYEDNKFFIKRVPFDKCLEVILVYLGYNENERNIFLNDEKIKMPLFFGLDKLFSKHEIFKYEYIEKSQPEEKENKYKKLFFEDLENKRKKI